MKCSLVSIMSSLSSTGKLSLIFHRVFNYEGDVNDREWTDTHVEIAERKLVCVT